MISFTRAKVTDSKQLAMFAEKLYRETFTSSNTVEDMNLYTKEAFNIDKVHSELEDPKRSTYLVILKKELIGYIQLNEISPDTDINLINPIELARFYLDSKFHGQQIAPTMMKYVLSESKSKKFNTIWLGVWEENFRAKAFYKKCGFLKIGQHIFQMGNDPQTDIILCRSID